MSEELRKHLNQLLEKVTGLYCILITDRDGVPLVRAVTERAPQLALRPGFISTFGMATDQASKLGLAKNKTIICMYSSYQIVSLCRLHCTDRSIIRYEPSTETVCHQHFEEIFVTDKVRLLKEAHPTLFTADEICSGIPSNRSQEDQKAGSAEHTYEKILHEDHTYYKEKYLPQEQIISHPDAQTKYEDVHLMDWIAHHVIQMNKLPLVLTFIGNDNCNTGHILSLESQIEPYLKDLEAVVSEPQ